MTIEPGHYRKLAEGYLSNIPLASLDRFNAVRELEQLLIRVATDEKLRWIKKK